jgi:aspartate kinase
MLRSVEFARRHGVPLHLRSSFTWEPGTWIVEEDPTMEEAVVSAVTDDTSEAKVTVGGVPDRPGVAARLFRQLADRGINVDMIVQNTSAKGITDISFTVAKTDLAAASEACDEVKGEIGATALMFETLSENGINIEMISTSSIRISCVVRADKVADAVRHLHAAFGLDAA